MTKVQITSFLDELFGAEAVYLVLLSELDQECQFSLYKGKIEYPELQALIKFFGTDKIDIMLDVVDDDQIDLDFTIYMTEGFMTDE